MKDLDEDKYKELFLYLNANIDYRDTIRKHYEEVVQLFQDDSLLEKIKDFHLKREEFIDLREKLPELEKNIRGEINRRLKNAN